MCFRKTPEPKWWFRGLIYVCIRKLIWKSSAFSRFAPDYRLENYASRKIRLSEYFVCYMCVTKKHSTLFWKSLFVFFWVIPHLTRPPHMFVLYPYPGIYFKYSLFVRIVLCYNCYVVQPIPGNGRRWSLHGEHRHFFSYLLSGEHSRLLCLQMVRWW